jgi:hypothetical protein
VVLGAGRDVAVRTVSVCVKLNARNEYEGSAVAYVLLAEQAVRDDGPSAEIYTC